MAKAIDVIPDTMVDLMIADSDFDSALAIIDGAWFRMPKQYFPVITVIMVGESTDAMMTGNKHRRAYAGMIQVEAVIQEVVTIAARKYTAEAAKTVNDLTSAVVEFFKEDAQEKLGDPAIDNGGIDLFEIGDDVEYTPAERENTFVWQSSIPFLCYTWETL
jgi:hypothetical protein